MGLLTNLVLRVNRGIRNVINGFTYADSLRSNSVIPEDINRYVFSGKGTTQVLGMTYQSYDNVQRDYGDFRAKLNSPEDKLDRNILNSLSDISQRVELLDEKKRLRNVANYSRCLEETMTEYSRHAWENSTLTDVSGNVSRPGITESNILKTIEIYFGKLKNVDRENTRYSSLRREFEKLSVIKVA